MQSKQPCRDGGRTQPTGFTASDDLDRFGQCLPLEGLLPPADDSPQPLSCPACGTYLGCVANSRAIALGHLERPENGWSRLIGGAVISEKRVSLKCPRCGYVNRWYRTQ